MATPSLERELRSSSSTLQLKYAKLHSQNNSRIPIKSSKSSRSISIQQLDEVFIINGQTKKSYIPRITSSPIVVKADSQTPESEKLRRVSAIVPSSTVTPLRDNTSNIETPLSTLTKLTSQLSALTISTPPFNNSPLSSKITKKQRDTGHKVKSAATIDKLKEEESPVTIINDSAFSALGTKRNVSKPISSTTNSHIHRLTKSQSLRSISSPMTLRSTSSTLALGMDETRYSRVPTRSIPKDSPSKRSVSSTIKRKPATSTDNSPLISRLTKSTTSFDLKATNHRTPPSRHRIHAGPQASLAASRNIPQQQQQTLKQQQKQQQQENHQSHSSTTPKLLNKRIVSDLQSTNYRTRTTRSSRLKHEASMVNLQSKVSPTIKQDPQPKLNVPKKRSIPQSISVNANLKELNLNNSPNFYTASKSVSGGLRRSSVPRSNVSTPTPIISSKRRDNKIATLEQLQTALTSHISTAPIVQSRKTPSVQPHLDKALNPPKSPREILASYSNSLNEYEKMEILKSKEIYYLGYNRFTISPDQDSSSRLSHNFGFDDEEKNLLVTKGDHINYRYEILDSLGNGMFGNVLKCYDHKFGEVFGVKIMKNDINWSLQSINEIKILKSLQEFKKEDGINDSASKVLRYVDHFNFRSHICITTELLSFTLLQLLECSNFKGFHTSILQDWSKQILQGLEFVHKHNIIHADLKPENIMITDMNSLNLKIIDFGSSCLDNDLSFPYIQSRFYRAPEVLLGARYNTAIDIWSFITLIYELHTGIPLFQASNELSLLKLIVKLIGYPNPRTILFLRNEIFLKGSINKSKQYGPEGLYIDKSSMLFTKFDRLGNYRGPPLDTPIKSQAFMKRIGGLKDINFASFLQSALCWDPKERPNATKLLQHEFLKN